MDYRIISIHQVYGKPGEGIEPFIGPNSSNCKSIFSVELTTCTYISRIFVNAKGVATIMM
jgi:hypothetical protein